MPHTAQALYSSAARQVAMSTDTDVSHDIVNKACRDIARLALEATNGRTTYSWEGNGVRITYAGDNPDGSFGATRREYLVDGEWRDIAPNPSQSGTGLLNLQLEHFVGCDDPLVEAKRQIAFLLLDPALNLAEFTMRTTSAWHGLMNEPFQYRSALAIRLSEVLEQKVMQNPQQGLNLQDLVNGVNAVGWVVRVLDGTIFNLMRRIHQNESYGLTLLDGAPEGSAMLYREGTDTPETEAVLSEDNARAQVLLDQVNEEAEQQRRRRTPTEADIVLARTFLVQTGLPNLNLPSVAKRRALLRELREDSTLAMNSFTAHYNLMHGDYSPSDAHVTNEWWTLWESYDAEDCERLMLLVNGGRSERLTRVVRGLLTPNPKLNGSVRERVMKALPAEHAESIVEALNTMYQNDNATNTRAFHKAARAAQMTPDEVIAIAERAMFSIVDAP